MRILIDTNILFYALLFPQSKPAQALLYIADSKKGASANDILYSIVKTAKANKLKPYKYIKYPLEQILLHV